VLLLTVRAETPDPAAVTELRAAGVEQLVFVKRLTYNSNHYYTEFIQQRVDARR